MEYITQRMADEVTSLLTTEDMKDEGYHALTYLQTSNFMSRHNDLFMECVKTMYSAYEEDGELDDLKETAMPFDDWFREFISEKLEKLIFKAKEHPSDYE